MRSFVMYYALIIKCHFRETDRFEIGHVLCAFESENFVFGVFSLSSSLCNVCKLYRVTTPAWCLSKLTL
jgi:hypothetical protein